MYTHTRTLVHASFKPDRAQNTRNISHVLFNDIEQQRPYLLDCACGCTCQCVTWGACVRARANHLHVLT